MVRNIIPSSFGRCRQHSLTTSHRISRRADGRHRYRFWLSAVAILSLAAPYASIFISGAWAKPPNRSFIGRRIGKQRNQQEGETAGLTLGDLDQMMQADKSNHAILGPNAIFGSDVTNDQHHQQQNQQYHGSVEEEAAASPNPNQLRRSLTRINLDLSGRVMCHVISPNSDDTHGDDVGRESIPLFSLPLKQQAVPAAAQTADAQDHQLNKKLQRIIPHIYLGANYDLDEVWYGATRWIARCSWGPLPSPGVYRKKSGSDRADESAGSWQLFAKNVHRKIFPSSLSSKTSWILDVEGEQSVFDRSDSTARMHLIQSPSPMLSKEKTGNTPQQISLEYNSAKYSGTPYATKRAIQYAPAITMGIKTSFLHPRLEIDTKTTFIVKEGGDNEGNYYGGDYFGSESSVGRRLEIIKSRYRDTIPRSNAMSSTATAQGRAHNFMSRLSRWLENDGWMPRKITTDLMGNLVSVSEVGLRNNPNDDTVGNKPPLRGAIHNTGIRLRMSKKIDWTSMGIFPWSKNNHESSGVFDALRSTHVRLELCGLYGSGERCASVGVDVDPLDWGRTLKVVVGQDGVRVLGNSR